MKKKNNKKWALVLVLLLVVSIGYAALSSNLKINGATGVKNASWIIHWANPQVAPGSVTETKPVLSESNTNATYSVTLSEPGDFYEFTIDAVNEGTIDAEILQIKSKFNGANGEDIITEGPNRNLPAYLEYEVTHADNEHSPITIGESLDHGQTETYRVRVAYSENIDPNDLEDEDITTTFYFEIEYKQKEGTNPAPSGNSPIRIVRRQVPGQITPGDAVVIEEDENDDTVQEFIVSKKDGNSVGGVVEIIIDNVPVGLGQPVFDKLDGDLAKALMNIGAVKAVEIGLGVQSSQLTGKEYNDQYILEDDIIKTETNNSGGILGGMSNGMPIILKITVKPTPSVSGIQKTVNLAENQQSIIEIEGRHDPCICPRITTVAESACNMVLVDHMIRAGFIHPDKI